MKKIIFIMCISLIGAIAYAKPVSGFKVPVLVKASFDETYPKAKVLKWAVTHEHDYKAEFKLGDTYGTAYYTAEGDFIESDVMVEWKDVPLTGRMEIYHLGESQIISVLKLENKKHEKFYQVELKRKNKKYEYLLDAEGNIIK